MNRYQVDYKEYGELVFQGKLTMEELQRFMKFIDDKKMKMIENGESSLIVKRIKEEQER